MGTHGYAAACRPRGEMRALRLAVQWHNKLWVITPDKLSRLKTGDLFRGELLLLRLAVQWHNKLLGDNTK
jgi:hypothetical protein